MFTDIEGSTRLHQRLGQAYSTLVRAHDELLTGVISDYGGAVIKSLGDGLFAAFSDVLAAVGAAAEVQRAVRDRRWPGGVELLVRVGLHRGAATPTDGDYVALSVHQAARVAAAAYGGQVLATADAVNAVPIPPVGSWRDLGAYRLKDFDEAVSLSMLVVPGAEFPVAGTRATPVAAHNVPELRTSFVGRQPEIAGIAEVVQAGARLVSVLGPGGVGKTRLAFELTKRLSSQFPEGAWVVLLANSHGSDIPERMLQTLGVPQRAGVAPLRTLLDVLTPRRCLLLLDNCEQVAPHVADVVAAVLDNCPQVSVLTTSREPLRLPDEVEWRLSPLPIEGAAAELFMQRATVRNPQLTFTAADRETIEAVCRSVDGLPLAVELAAGRLRHMPLRQLVAGIEDRLGLLTTSVRGMAPRQRTLHDLVEWSYSLLDPTQQRLLRTLSVFWSPMRLDAIVAVAGADQVVDGLADLVDKSLVMLTDDRDRPYRMLVIIRDFAAVKLAEAGEANETRRRHAAWHREFAQKIASGCDTQDVARWTAEAAASYDDLAAAMSFADETDHGDELTQIALGLYEFYVQSGLMNEGRRWFERAAAAAVDPVLSASVTSHAGELALVQSDLRRARELCEDGLRRSRDCGDAEVLAAATGRLSQVCAFSGDFGCAKDHASAALRSGDPRTRIKAYNALGATAYFQDDLAEAERHYRASYREAEESGLERQRLIAQVNLGEVLLERSSFGEAERLFLSALTGIGQVKAQVHLLYELLSRLYVATDDTERAATWRDRALQAAVEIGSVDVERRLRGTMAGRARAVPDAMS